MLSDSSTIAATKVGDDENTEMMMGAGKDKNLGCRDKFNNLITFYYIAGIEVSRTPKGLPEQLAIVLTYQCKLFLGLPHATVDNEGVAY
jgi:hypothetical protein